MNSQISVNFEQNQNFGTIMEMNKLTKIKGQKNKLKSVLISFTL